MVWGLYSNMLESRAEHGGDFAGGGDEEEEDEEEEEEDEDIVEGLFYF